MDVVKYRTIVADPPWEFNWNFGTGGRRRNVTALGYSVQDIEWIKGLPVADMAEDDTALFLWATQEMIHTGQARAVAVAWGFPRRVGEIVWRKPNYGAGAFPRAGHETCLLYGASSGSFSGAPLDVHSVQTWSQPRASNNGGKIHSAKPDGFYDLVESALPGPYVELFARRARFGWSYWGDESLGTADLGSAA